MPIMPGAEPFRADGTGLAVLLCHGFTGTPQSLRPLAERLGAVGYTVRLPRLPGHGTSWQELNRTRWPDWYDAVERELVDLHHHGDQVVVGGLSMGGALAARLAQEHGPRVSGLVLINPAFHHDDPRLLLLPVLQHLLPSLPGISNDRRSTAGEPELAYDRLPLRALQSQPGLWRTVVADLARVTQPVLLLRSAVDHVVPASSAELFLSQVGSTDVTDVVLTDSYHVATLDYDAALIEQRVLDFLARIEGRSH